MKYIIINTFYCKVTILKDICDKVFMDKTFLLKVFLCKMIFNLLKKCFVLRKVLYNLVLLVDFSSEAFFDKSF